MISLSLCYIQKASQLPPLSLPHSLPLSISLSLPLSLSPSLSHPLSLPPSLSLSLPPSLSLALSHKACVLRAHAVRSSETMRSRFGFFHRHGISGREAARTRFVHMQPALPAGWGGRLAPEDSLSLCVTFKLPRCKTTLSFTFSPSLSL